jgi:hypothetical protein
MVLPLLGVAPPALGDDWSEQAPNLAAANPREVREAYCKNRRRELTIMGNLLKNRKREKTASRSECLGEKGF